MDEEENRKKILENIENPLVRRAIQRRCANFMFNYGDSDDHSDHHDQSRKWSEYSDYYDHTDSDYHKETKGRRSMGQVGPDWRGKKDKYSEKHCDAWT